MYQFSATFDDIESGIFIRLIVVEVPYGESVRYLLDRLYRDLRPEQRTNVTIILRPGVKFQLSKTLIEQYSSLGLGESECLEQQYDFLKEIVEDIEKTLRRFSSHSVHVLGSERYGHFLTGNINPTATLNTDLSDKSVTARLIETIRAAEIDHLVMIGGCKLPRLGQQYYRAPSGRYMRAFLRVGNLQTSRSAIDALFFWLVPYLENCIGIITDTWSISSISQNASRRLFDYGGGIESPCPIEMLGDYHDRPEYYGSTAAEKIERFIFRIEARGEGACGQVVILISATHTGSMVCLIEKYLKLRGIPLEKVVFVSLFKLSHASSIPTLRDLSEDKDFSVVDNLSEEERATAIDIHSSLYFPATQLDIEKNLLLSVIEPYGKFCRTYGDISFARVHHTDSESNPLYERHHGVWIDTEQLVAHSHFLTLFNRRILELDPPPTIIIHPNHTVAHSLSQIAVEVLRKKGMQTLSFPHDDLKLMVDLSDDDGKVKTEIEDLGESEAILLLDDAFIAGTRISSYQKNLRDLSFSGVFHYLVAISRPEERRIWEDQRRAFVRARALSSSKNGNQTPHNTFDSIEMLVLPNWTEDQCPWCAEMDEVAQMRQAHQGLSLNSHGKGMDQDIFIVPTGYSPLELKKDSFLGPPNIAQSNVFCAVAGALQILRTEPIDKTPLLNDQFFLIKPVLKETYYLRYFTDSILMASILRAARASELVYGDMDREKRRTRAIGDYLRTKTTGDLACEVALAESLGKFPEFRTIDATMSAELDKLCAR